MNIKELKRAGSYFVGIDVATNVPEDIWENITFKSTSPEDSRTISFNYTNRTRIINLDQIEGDEVQLIYKNHKYKLNIERLFNKLRDWDVMERIEDDTRHVN